MTSFGLTTLRRAPSFRFPLRRAAPLLLLRLQK
jgi:hypothetical protein